jgi:UDP-glucose 4-epimerase
VNILVIGGNGFIGSHFVDFIVAAGGASVRVLDRPGSLRREGILSVDYLYGDFSDVATVAEALTGSDVVVHLASTTVPGTGDLDPIADIESNLVPTVRLLQQMRALNVRRLIYFSSGGTVYGNTQMVPIPEEHERNPLSSYGIVKVAIENYIEAFAAQKGIEALILRPSNPYGPRQGHIGVQGVIPTFFQRILKSEPLQIWGDGNNVRDYIYIDDVVRFITLALEHSLTGVFNIGSGQGSSVKDVLKIISEVTGISAEVRYLPARRYDVRSVILDITKARSVLPWAPLVSLRDGCERYWRWLTAQQVKN